MIRSLLRLTVTTTVLALFALTQGCSSDDGAAPPLEMGKVTGTVTLDGKPLAGVEIIFAPDEGGGSSSGATDDAGNFSLEYSGGGRIGAVVGTHTISFRDDGEEMSADGDPLPGGGEEGRGSIPQKYVEGMSTIKRDVTSGEQSIILELTSKD